MTDKITIRTNNKARDVLSWHDLTDKERADFDYIDTEEQQLEASFVRYKGCVYDLGEFMTCRNMPEFSPITNWDGHFADSYFSGVLLRYVDNFERVIMATYFA